MFGKVLDLGVKRDVLSAVIFFLVHLTILVGLSTVLVHYMGVIGLIDVVTGTFFDGGTMHTLIGSVFVLYLGGMTLTKRRLTNDLMSIIIVSAAVYLAWTTSVVFGLIPIALLTTIGK